MRPANIAKAEAQKAAKIIGAELICLNKPSLNLIHNEELVYEIEDVVDKFKPDILLTHWGGDFHSDHVAVSLSSLRASRNTQTIWSYRSNWYATEQVFAGSCYVDISTYLEEKLEMIKVYKSVLEPVNYSWIDFIRRQNIYEGMKVGVDAAECFYCVKHVV
jgi:LmbE family N-acetylglucosaminyl deacetylase